MTFWAFLKHHFQLKPGDAIFWATFGKNGLFFVPTSGHTGDDQKVKKDIIRVVGLVRAAFNLHIKRTISTSKRKKLKPVPNKWQLNFASELWIGLGANRSRRFLGFATLRCLS